MSSGRQADAKQTNHPQLGPSVEIADDRPRALGNLLFGLACMCLGPAGLMWGIGDLQSGSTLLGIGFVGGSSFLFAYGARLAFASAQRLRHRVALVVGRDGFLPAGGEPVGWDEVAMVSDPASPPGAPRIVRVQLVDPDEYVARHHLGPIARFMQRTRQDDLFLGRDMEMPVEDVEALMRKRLVEYRRSPSGASEAPARPSPEPRHRSRRPNRGRR